MAIVNTLREGQLFSVTWNEQDMSHCPLEPSWKRLTKIELSSGISIYLYLQRSVNSSAIHPVAGGPIIQHCVKLRVMLVNIVLVSRWNDEASSIVIDATMDGVRRRQMSREEKLNNAWTASWDNHQAGEGSAFQLLIDFNPTETSAEISGKKSSVPLQIMEKMFSDHSLADVTFKFTGNNSQ